MKFGAFPIDEAAGKILAHNISRVDGRRAYRKGKIITPEDISVLRTAGFFRLYLAELETGDYTEDQAAQAIAEAAMGPGLEIKRAAEGRASLRARYRGVLKVDASRLEKLNSIDGIAFATLPGYHEVSPGQTVSTVKIIPYGLSSSVLEQAVKSARGDSPILENYELKPLSVGLLFSGNALARDRITRTFDLPLRRRVEACGSMVTMVDFVPMDGNQDSELLVTALQCQAQAGVKMIILASETSIMDIDDIAPSAVIKAGGEVVCVGAPVDPGNLMMVGYLGAIPILGVPGCARSPKKNIVDKILPAILAGQRLNRADIARLGYGGLLLS